MDVDEGVEVGVDTGVEVGAEEGVEVGAEEGERGGGVPTWGDLGPRAAGTPALSRGSCGRARCAAPRAAGGRPAAPTRRP
jgi:hypothetical protein